MQKSVDLNHAAMDSEYTIGQYPLKRNNVEGISRFVALNSITFIGGIHVVLLE